jgi:hypothetical protein
VSVKAKGKTKPWSILYARASWGAAVLRPYTFCGDWASVVGAVMAKGSE